MTVSHDSENRKELEAELEQFYDFTGSTRCSAASRNSARLILFLEGSERLARRKSLLHKPR